MKKLTKLMLLPAVIFINLTLNAQNANQHFTGSQATRFYKGASNITINGIRNSISFIRLNETEEIDPATAPDWLKKDVLQARAEDNLSQYQKFNDKIGMTHVRYRQQYKGVPVEYGVYYVHSKGDRVKSANGEWYNGINISTTPSLNSKQAYSNACKYMNAKVWWHEEEETDNNKLMILPVDDEFKLVYKCDVSSLQPRARNWVYVDAQNGSIVKTESRIHHTNVEGTAVTAYCGVPTIVSDSFQTNLFRLRDYSRGAGIETFNNHEPVDFTSTTKDWNYNGGFDQYALDAHYGAESTYDYYNDNYGWKSVDGNGTQKLKSLVHAGSGINAFWDGTYMSYLDGDGSNGNQPLTSMEVCGHELTHGVTEHSSGLIYSCESGGINESMSDIFGVTIRFLYTSFGSWYLGDQWDYIIRNMANPNEYNNPDCYEGTFWSTCPEVHSGSGVGNFWYYLLVEGGSDVNDVGNSYYVEGIGLEDAGAIAFRTNTVYLTPSSPYSDLYEYSIQSSLDLFGDCTPQTINTANAGYAVNIGGPFSGGVNAIFTADQSSFCSLPAVVNFSNGSTNATSYLWNFGDGTTSTEMNPSHTYTTVGDFTVSLIVNGYSLCNTDDTTIKENFVHTQSIGAPSAASCIPVASLPGPKFGIFNVTLGDINNSSSNSTEGYKDFSCSAFTKLTTGVTYSGSIKLSTKGDDARVWIDNNGDGIFSGDELIYSVDGSTGVNSFSYTAPANATLNTPFRMRVIEDKQSNTITDGCYNPDRGQCEDYMVYYVSPAILPAADFVASSTVINEGDIISFTDLSTNTPTSWSWNFNGGSPSTSTEQNPTGIQFNTAGVYDISLTATNAAGSNTVVKVAYITVNAVGCQTPAGLTTTNITTTTATFNWNAVNGAVKYKVRYKVSGNNPWITSTVTTNFINVTGLLENTDYKWKVKTICSTNPNVSSAYSALQSFTTASHKLEEVFVQEVFNVFPNPTSARANIDFSLNEEGRALIQLYNIEGKLLQTIVNEELEAGVYSKEFDGSLLSAGVYFIKFSATSGDQLKKIVIQK